MPNPSLLLFHFPNSARSGLTAAFAGRVFGFGGGAVPASTHAANAPPTDLLNGQQPVLHLHLLAAGRHTPDHPVYISPQRIGQIGDQMGSQHLVEVIQVNPPVKEDFISLMRW